MEHDKENFVRRKAKDSVFCDLFSEPKYQMELYKVLHPEDQTITEDDFETVTVENIITNQMYNDLGFMARNQMIVLVEAMSKWSINIIPRIDMYKGESINNYILKTNQKKYSTKKMQLPRPEFYVLYTCEKETSEWLSLADEFYGGDTLVRVLRGTGGKDIISQYVAFTKILDEQEKIYGRTKIAITETISICIEKNILKEYLERRHEVMDIMTLLYDQELAIKEYGEEQRDEGKKESLKEVVKKMVMQGFTDDQIQAVTDYGRKEIMSMRLELNNR